MTDSEREHELVRAAVAGDLPARRELVLRLLPIIEARVMHALCRYRRGADAAQVRGDLTQQVFLSLFDNEGEKLLAWKPDRGASLASFVGLLAEHEVVGVLRRDRRNPWKELPTVQHELVNRAGVDRGHELLVANRELLDMVLDRALSELGTSELEIFRRLVLDEAPVETVAEETSHTVGALHMWKSRFTKRVRALAHDLTMERIPLRPVPVRRAPLGPALRAR